MKKQYRYLISNSFHYKRYATVKNETTQLVIALFLNSTDNSSSSIAKITHIPEYLVSEIISDMLKHESEVITTVLDAPRFHNVTESSIRDISPIDSIIARFNTFCQVPADFSTRLQTLKTLR